MGCTSLYPLVCIEYYVNRVPYVILAHFYLPPFEKKDPTDISPLQSIMYFAYHVLYSPLFYVLNLVFTRLFHTYGHLLLYTSCVLVWAQKISAYVLVPSTDGTLLLATLVILSTAGSYSSIIFRIPLFSKSGIFYLLDFRFREFIVKQKNASRSSYELYCYIITFTHESYFHFLGNIDSCVVSLYSFPSHPPHIIYTAALVVYNSGTQG